MIKCFTFEKKKEKNKTRWKSMQRYIIGFAFGDQDTIEGVITFMIGSRTIKREISEAIDHLSATR
jgi:hypothetical protein